MYIILKYTVPMDRFGVPNFFSLFFFSLVPFSPHYWPLAEYRTAIQPSEHARLDQINALAL